MSQPRGPRGLYTNADVARLQYQDHGSLFLPDPQQHLVNEWDWQECVEKMALPKEKECICDRAWTVIQETAELQKLPVVSCCEEVCMRNSPPLEDAVHNVWADGSLVVGEKPVETICQLILRSQKVGCLEMY